MTFTVIGHFVSPTNRYGTSAGTLWFTVTNCLVPVVNPARSIITGLRGTRTFLAGSLILDIDVPSTVAGVEVQLAPVAVQVSVRATNLLHPVLTGLDTPTGRPLGAGVNHTHLGWGTGEILTQITLSISIRHISLILTRCLLK